MATDPMSPQQFDAIVDRAVLPADRQIDLPAHRSRRYVVIDGEVLLLRPGTGAERCGPGTILEPTLGRLVLRTANETVLGIMDEPCGRDESTPVNRPS